MLIIPAEHPLDWKKPPIVTLLLILLNMLVYFGYQGGDSEREAHAIQTYLDGGLLNRERALFIPAFAERRELDADTQRQVEAMRRTDLARLVLYDLEFENRLHHNPDYLADAEWQAARQKAEAARDQLSSMRFGFIPKRFTFEGLFGAMFLHGDFGHLLGNMVFLFIFGFALEIALGRWLYLGLYLLSGVASHLLWWIMDPGWITGVGASGAISGLMGMYLGVYGLRRINFFYWLGPLFGYFRAPALWILPVWAGKELYGLLLADDNVNYYAHLGGLIAGFGATWLPKAIGTLKVDEAYLNKEDPLGPFKRELQGLDQLIGSFSLDQASSRGLDMLTRYPQQLPLLERLYPLAVTRQDKPLLSAVLKQLFSLPANAGHTGLLKRLATDSGTPGAGRRLLQHPAIQLHLLTHLVRTGEGALALGAWRRLKDSGQRPTALPTLTLQLAKQLNRQQDLRGIAELGQFLDGHYPDAEQTQQLNLLRQHLR
ncbi:rhomboid family intramembrane serine protease [Pseudomonas sp. GD03944]|uniref:rhomboid family intramembrane serine protease n=1 Tax=Pseudomonas sp. GD03944 TaxID=2975409 RepID=UPI0024499E24|nr:rhomboid family intramembrane serine protease [Pseudomonas sp. GD03944]MDH1265608.1 rhomboid family intramembrane serine protease [Pseudomonas sp. GD03944]